MTQKETIKKVLHYIRRYRFFLIASLVLALITVVLTLYVPILTGQAVDLIVGKGQVDFAGVYHICVKIGIAILLTMVAQWVMNVANNKITYSVVRDIRTDPFEKIQVLPLSYIDSHSYGGIVSRVIADADQFADDERYEDCYRHALQRGERDSLERDAGVGESEKWHDDIVDKRAQVVIHGL